MIHYSTKTGQWERCRAGILCPYADASEHKEAPQPAPRGMWRGEFGGDREAYEAWHAEQKKAWKKYYRDRAATEDLPPEQKAVAADLAEQLSREEIEGLHQIISTLTESGQKAQREFAQKEARYQRSCERLASELRRQSITARKYENEARQNLDAYNAWKSRWETDALKHQDEMERLERGLQGKMSVRDFQKTVRRARGISRSQQQPSGLLLLGELGWEITKGFWTFLRRSHRNAMLQVEDMVKF